jgi:hypothetical protein
MTKTLNQIIFFPPPKSEYFVQQHWESEYFFFELNGRSLSCIWTAKSAWIAKTIGHCRSIKSRSNDCRSNKCRSNDCRSIECRSNDIIPIKHVTVIPQVIVNQIPAICDKYLISHHDIQMVNCEVRVTRSLVLQRAQRVFLHFPWFSTTYRGRVFFNPQRGIACFSSWNTLCSGKPRYMVDCRGNPSRKTRQHFIDCYTAHVYFVQSL